VAKFSDLLARSTIQGKGKALFHQGQPAWGFLFVCKGWVKLTRVLSSGEEVIVSILAPCSAVAGMDGRDQSAERLCSAVTIDESTEVAYVKTPKLFSLFQSLPALGIGMMEHLAEKLREISRIIAALTLPVEQRLIAMLGFILGLQKGKDGKEPKRIPLSQRELAQFAQTTPESKKKELSG
jgi:CRP-like cAMP-binding protein